ncbi:hypothetical protein [Planococcus glaciei]|uniref:hypothetical protein n=1 Tax=Planococcus glaciei TaxID=459472 RepID=UPI001C730B20|nr:hypothetical protein [Planococcus glaciei]MBX0313308.1 hypothetical protein [Planococcus glaciei]
MRMERDELLKALENDLGFVQKYRKKEQEYIDLDSFLERGQVETKDQVMKWILLITLPLGFMLFNLLNPFKEPNNFEDIIGGILVALVIAFILKKKTTWTNEKKLRAIDGELKRLENDYYENSKVPETARGIHKTERFYYYLSSFIADDLKECAKLYHQEQQNDRLISSMEAVSESVWDSSDEIAAQLSQVNKSVKSVNSGIDSVDRSVRAADWNANR